MIRINLHNIAGGTRLAQISGLALLISASAAWPAQNQPDPPIDSPEQQRAPTAFAEPPPEPVLEWGTEEGTSWWIPAADIVLFDFLLNQFNREFSGTSDYDVDKDSLERNFKGSWVYDNDPFDINQFGHPYQGSMYHGFARSAGHGYWTSTAYTVLGSAAWEIAGERTPPSINDQITTGIGGGFLGEPLFRMASLLLESSGGKPGLWHELGAAALSPATGFNRLAFGDRFDGVFRSQNPAVYTRIGLGLNVDSSVDSNVNTNRDAEALPIPQSYDTGTVTGDFTIAYGLPGKKGYTYERPFDYFHFQFSAASSNFLENVISRGLLYGTDYEAGDNYRGVWGLYGTYDYLAPQIFRISTTGLGLGTTGQWWISEKWALQGTLLGGVGYGSAGALENNRAQDRDYQNGLSGQALVAMRLIHGDRASLDMNVRQYHVSDVGTDIQGGEENIFRADVTLTVRVHKLHALTFGVVTSRRDAQFDGFDDTHQQVVAFNLGYAYLGQTRSGAVDWRPRSEGGPGASDLQSDHQ